MINLNHLNPVKGDNGNHYLPSIVELQAKHKQRCCEGPCLKDEAGVGSIITTPA
jgi:hypothetical protein